MTTNDLNTILTVLVIDFCWKVLVVGILAAEVNFQWMNNRIRQL